MAYDDDLYGLVDDDIMGIDTYGAEDFDLDAGPTLGAAFLNNKIKGLLLLAGVYTTGALMGRARSWDLAKRATQKTGQGLAFLGKKTGEGIQGISAMADEAAKKRAAEAPIAGKGVPYRMGAANKTMQLSVHKGKKFYG